MARWFGILASLMLFSIPLAPHVQAQAACTHYASPSGGGNGLSQGSPFQISQFWAVATPGKVLCLLNGTYTGGNAMIQSPPSFAGTSSQPITIRALNDGQVLIDGQDGLRPVDLQGSWGILEGINATRGDNANIRVRGSNWKVRRVVGWNGGVGQAHIISVSGSNNLVEDCAAFGTSEKAISAGSAGSGVTNATIRRCWSRSEDAGDAPGATNGAEQGYGQDGVTFENVLVTWNRTGVNGQPTGMFRSFRTQNSKALGMIIYMPVGSVPGPSDLVSIITDGGSPQQHGDYHVSMNNLYRDIVAYVQPGHANFGSLRAFDVRYASPGPHGNNNLLDNIVGVAGATSFFQGAPDYTVTNSKLGTTLAAAIGAGNSLWTVVPGVCKRYVNGTLTNDGLWPWPMNQRIMDALRQSGRAVVDITATIESLLGPIPAHCRGGSSKPVLPVPPAPRNLRVLLD